MAGPEYDLKRLDGIEAKLDRAEQQIEWARAFPGAWSAREEPYTFAAKINQRERRYVWEVVACKPLPPVHSVVGDEIVYHLRSALDHLAGYLVKASGGTETNHTAWPLETSARGWKRNVERRRHSWQFWRKAGGGPLAGLPVGSPAWAFIQREQPYKRGGKATEDALFSLNKLWNQHKHRILNETVTYLSIDGEDVLDYFDIVPFVEPVERRWLVNVHELKLGTKIALFRFPKDQPLPLMKMKVDAKLPAEIAVGRGKGISYDLADTLALIRALVAEAQTVV